MEKQEMLNLCLFEAIRCDDEAKARLLISQGADVDTEIENFSLLMMACAKGSRNIAELLVKNGVSINATNSAGYTALMFACAVGNFEIVKLLVENGAVIEIKNADWGTAVLIASENGFTEIAQFLQNIVTQATQNVDVEAGSFMKACECGDIDFVREALKHNKSLANARDRKGGDTALMKAACNGKKNVVKFLIENGADVNMKNYIGFTAIHWAFDSEDLSIIELLVNAGADVNAKDITGGFPLSIAAAKGYYDIVRLLLSNGANVNERSNSPFGGSSALDMAEMGGYKNIISLLRAYGAK